MFTPKLLKLSMWLPSMFLQLYSRVAETSMFFEVTSMFAC